MGLTVFEVVEMGSLVAFAETFAAKHLHLQPEPTFLFYLSFLISVVPFFFLSIFLSSACVCVCVCVCVCSFVFGLSFSTLTGENPLPSGSPGFTGFYLVFFGFPWILLGF